MMRSGLLFFLAFVLSACAGHRPPVADVAVVERPQAVPYARVHFATASDRVRRQEQALVVENARWLQEHPAAMLVLDGHCDERGPDAFNLRLGDRRARAVKAMLARAGVDGARSIVVSSGEGRPVDPGHHPAAWRKNRRVEFVIP